MLIIILAIQNKMNGCHPNIIMLFKNTSALVNSWKAFKHPHYMHISLNLASCTSGYWWLTVKTWSINLWVHRRLGKSGHMLSVVYSINLHEVHYDIKIHKSIRMKFHILQQISHLISSKNMSLDHIQNANKDFGIKRYINENQHTPILHQ